jgi:hypothetical protein
MMLRAIAGMRGSHVSPQLRVPTNTSTKPSFASNHAGQSVVRGRRCWSYAPPVYIANLTTRTTYSSSSKNKKSSMKRNTHACPRRIRIDSVGLPETETGVLIPIPALCAHLPRHAFAPIPCRLPHASCQLRQRSMGSNRMHEFDVVCRTLLCLIGFQLSATSWELNPVNNRWFAEAPSESYLSEPARMHVTWRRSQVL